MQRDLSTRVEDRLNGFEVVKSLKQKDMWNLFYPIEIVYRPISNIKQTIIIFQSLWETRTEEHLAKARRRFEKLSAEQCYGCNKCFVEIWKTVENMPIVVYKFNNQNLQMFEDNYKFLSGVPFSVYFDFETTCGRKSFEFYDNTKSIQFLTHLLLHSIPNRN